MSMHAGLAFPVIRKRMHELQKSKGGVTKARALAYVVEYTIAARRAARENVWPKTIGLAGRRTEKASKLAGLKKHYD